METVINMIMGTAAEMVKAGTLFVFPTKNLLWKNAYWGSYSPFWAQQG